MGDIVIGIKSIIYEKNNNTFIININNESKIQYNNNIVKSIDNISVFKYLDSLYGIIDDWQKEYYGKSSYPTNFEAFERLNQKLIDEVQNGHIEY